MGSELKLVKTADLCKIFGVTRQAIYKWRKKGLPVVIKYKGGTQRYDLDEVYEWLNHLSKTKPWNDEKKNEA